MRLAGSGGGEAVQIWHFRCLPQAMNWRQALGWAVAAVAPGHGTIPCHDAHPKWSGVGLSDIPFLWEESLRRGFPGDILGPQQLGAARVEKKTNQDPEWVKWHATELRCLGREARCSWGGRGWNDATGRRSFLPRTCVPSRLQDCTVQPLWF